MLPESCPLLENPDAADRWVRCCSQHFYRLARCIAGDDGLAEDALQNSWLKVLRHPHSGGFQGANACRWVRIIVANSAKDIRRKRLRSREVSLPQAAESILATDFAPLVDDWQTLRMLREMVAGLPDPYRQVVEMRFDQELSTSETAERMGISRSNVATRLNRSLRMLRERFAARHGERSP